MQTDASTNTRVMGKKDCPKRILLLVEVVFLPMLKRRARKNLASTDIKSSSRMADVLDLRARVASSLFFCTTLYF